MKYTPDRAVDARDWQAHTESELLQAVEDHHRLHRIRVPKPRLHASIHVIVENQVASGGAIPAAAVLARLMEEGLSRHDAVHAIGSVVASQIFDVLKKKVPGQDVAASYLEKLEQLTAESWLKSQT